MSNLSEQIKAREKKSRQNKLMMNILGFVVIIFMVSSVMLYSQLKKEKKALTESETNLKISYDSISKVKNALAKSDSILTIKNAKLLQARGSIESYWTDAVNKNRIKHYANYLSKAIEGDKHYGEALTKMNDLAKKQGYVQVTESNGNVLLEKLNNIDTEDNFYEALSDRSIRRGVVGNSDFTRQGRNGDAIKAGDVVKVVRIIPSGNAQWAEIRYSN